MSALPPERQKIIDRKLQEILGEKYLSYALSAITGRALPDVRDGLKPVHRRILYAMSVLKLDPASAFKKCARVVGDVIGKYHPHGDQSVYDAMVRLAQDFAVRYPLVDGQGNFGNVDGDNAAAMRYTESRLTEVAKIMLEGLDEDAVDFLENYDGSEKEPAVLPAAFPNLLANGSTGIAVGMATNIPPHNVGELCEALHLLLKNPDATIKQIIEKVPGPDFPTGGCLIETPENILQSYETGRGGFRLRARWHKEDTGRGTYAIIITEIPYQVQKSKLIEKTAQLIDEKRLPLIHDIRDESSDDIRIVLEPKNKNIDEVALTESLFKITDFETRFSMNMNVLNAQGVPGVLSLKDILVAFLNHRLDTVRRRARYRLSKIETRLEILDGFLIAFLNLDEVIRIIREEDYPKKNLIERFSLTDNQAEGILNIRLRALAKLEEIQIRTEHKNLSDEKVKLLDLLSSEAKQKDSVRKELKKIQDRFGENMPNGDRKTSFENLPETDFDSDTAFVEREPVTVVLSVKGWIRAVKGHIAPDTELKFREDDGEAFRVPSFTAEKVILFAGNGKAYTLSPEKLPGGRGTGEPVRLMIELPDDAEPIALYAYKPNDKFLIAADDGRGFVCPAEAMIASTKTGKQILTVSDKVKAIVCTPVTGDRVACVGENRKLLIFSLKLLPEMTKGKGVTLQRYKDGGLSDAVTFASAEGLLWDGRVNALRETEEFEAVRGGSGRVAPRGFPRNGKFRTIQAL